MKYQAHVFFAPNLSATAKFQEQRARDLSGADNVGTGDLEKGF